MAVYILHPDLDVLAAIVGEMRDRNLETVHGTEAASLVDRAKRIPPSLLIAPEDGDARLEAELAKVRQALAEVPELVCPPLEAGDEAGIARLVDDVMSTLVAAAPASNPASAGSGEVRGDLAQVALPDLLQLLTMGRKTGALTITTSNAAGELRLVDGDVVDAMFRRADGMKAVVRLLGERDGVFHFAPDDAPALRRLREPTSQLLMEGTRQADEIKRLRERLGFVGATPVLAMQVGATTLQLDVEDALVREVARALATPRPLDELLDDLPSLDLDILGALARIDEAGGLRRLPIGDLRPSLAGPEGMVVLRGLARRLRPRGYRGHGRLVLVGSPPTIRLARQAIPRLAEAMPIEATSEVLADRIVEITATLQLGDTVGLDVVTVADRADAVAILPMVLNGAIGVIALERPSMGFAQVVEDLEVALVDARSVGEDLPFGVLDPGDPTAIAAVVRGALEGMGET